MRGRRQYVFIGYHPQELRDTPHYRPSFRQGDLLAKLQREKHLGPDEIIVIRLEDGCVDSVWSEEVEELDC